MVKQQMVKQQSVEQPTARLRKASCSLTPEELQSYRENGFLIRESVFTAEELVAMRACVEEAVETAHKLSRQGKTYHLDNKRFVDIDNLTVQFEHEIDSETIRVIEPVHHLNSGLGSLVEDARIVDPIQSIIGTERVSVWTNKLNLKRAKEGSGFGWHQDSPYWVHDSDHVDLLPNVYLAFDDADEIMPWF